MIQKSQFEVGVSDRPNILLVEDNVDVRQLISITLSDEFNVFGADNVAEAKRYLNAVQVPVVLLDVMLPGEEDGFQLLSWIRRNPRNRHTRVIMVTARGQARDYYEGLERGADAYIIKPFSPLSLLAEVRSQLELRPKQ
jgi:DNA-binding response OmpR family regulator